MDDDRLRTRHVLAAIALGLGFAALSVLGSPLARARDRVAALRFAPGRRGSQPDRVGG